MHRACSLFLLLAFVTFAHAAEDKAPESELISIVRENPGAKLTAKMKSIILPSVQFRSATLEEALEYLRKQSRTFDKSSGPPETKGVKIILRPLNPPSEASISLDLKNETLYDALLYVSELAQMVFKVEADAVVVKGIHDYQGQGELHTRTFKVPPDFLSAGGSESGSPEDPFAANPTPAPAPSGSAPKIPRRSAKQILEGAGIQFPEGASASFNPMTSRLKVTNILPNLDLVEAYVDSCCICYPKTTAFHLTIVEGPGELIRQINADASKSADASKHLATLLDLAQQKDSSVHRVGHAFLEIKSGHQATTAAVCEPWLASALPQDARVPSSALPEMPPAGLRLQLEPTIGADGQTIDLTLDLALSPPASQQQPHLSESPAAHFTTSLVTHNGTTKWVGMTKPSGLQQTTDDTLWAVFLTSAIHLVDGQSQPLLPSILSGAKPPKGMTSISYHIPAGLFESIMTPSPKPLREWLIGQGVTFPPGSKLDYQNELLQATNTEENIEAISSLVGYAVSDAQKILAITLHTVRLPPAFLRKLSEATLAANDHTVQWQEVEAAATRGEAFFLESCFFETKSGIRATHTSGRASSFFDQTTDKDRSLPGISLGRQTLGSFLEVEPTLGADGRTIDVLFNHELHVATGDPNQASPDARIEGSFRTLKTFTGIALTDGQTKLVALHQDIGPEHQDHLWATFLRCNAVPQFRKPRQAAANPATPQADKEAMETKTYRTPADFLQRITSFGDAASEPPADPFASSTRPPPRYIFESLGVTFPDGSSAAFDPKTSTLIVRNTPANHALIAAAVEKIILSTPATAAFTTHVLQGPGPLLRRLAAQASHKSDHRAELDELLAAAKAGTVLHLDTARIETKSGARATTQQGRTHSSICEFSMSEKGLPVFKRETSHVGLNLELEPTLGADGSTVELTLSPEFHTAPPFKHREYIIDTQGRRLEFPLTDYFASKLTTRITILDGTARLISLYKPVGKPEFEKEDILQAIFLTCDILRVRE